jgi:hypothetical protein
MDVIVEQRLLPKGRNSDDRSGERISVTSHLLRHAAATVQRRHQYGVPLELLKSAMGHTPGPDGQAPEATRYYSQMTKAQKAEIRHETIVAMMDDAQVAVRIIDPDDEAKRINRLMDEADDRTREPGLPGHSVRDGRGYEGRLLHCAIAQYP